MSSPALAEDELAHYGVKGMKWGKRKARSESSSSPLQRKVKPEVPASEDAVQYHERRDKIKSGGTDALSTKELQEVVTRMNLEKQYSELKSPIGNQKLAAEILGSAAGTTGKEVGKQTARMIKDYQRFQVDGTVPPPSPGAKKIVGDIMLTVGGELAKEYAGKLATEAVKAMFKR